jgi:hypothetical protein
MLGIARKVTKHALRIKSGSKQVQQRLRCFDEEKRMAIGEEIAKLLAVGFIKEVCHLEWLANPILEKKKSGKWRMCVDYTSLNKACPKDLFPLPRIDHVVDLTSGCETLCFLDAYYGYHKITMKESNQLVTSLITSFGSYYYVSMPFGLKNVGAAYQRCMLKCFDNLIGETIKAYMDDIVVKSKTVDQLAADLKKPSKNSERTA